MFWKGGGVPRNQLSQDQLNSREIISNEINSREINFFKINSSRDQLLFTFIYKKNNNYKNIQLQKGINNAVNSL